MTRVAYLLKKFPRLSETFVLGELLAQEKRGAHLHVFSRKTPDDEPRHPELAQLRAVVEVLPGRTSLDPWSELFAPSSGASDPRDWGRMERLMTNLRPLAIERLPRLVAEALYLRGRCRALSIEHVHAHFATESAIVAMILHELGGPSYSMTAHAKDIYRSTVAPALLQRLVALSRFTVTVCDANVAHMRSLVGPEAGVRIRRLYNGLDLERYRYHPAPRDDHHVLAIGRLVEKKGFDVMIDACALMRDEGVTFRVTLAGDGEARADLERRIHDLSLERHVTLTGPLAQDRVRALFARATVFCLPCIVADDGNRDALPTVLLEALASGLPCVSTPVTGIPEILGDGGVLVPERDTAATARALGALLADPRRREALAREGRDRAERLFDGARAAELLLTWFRESADASAVSRTTEGVA